jgi:hypothetical protein
MITLMRFHRFPSESTSCLWTMVPKEYARTYHEDGLWVKKKSPKKIECKFLRQEIEFKFVVNKS